MDKESSHRDIRGIFGEPVDPALRNQLGQLYGDATKLVERGLDGINTADLGSGQQRSTVQK